jgi:hypothetical protein
MPDLGELDQHTKPIGENKDFADAYRLSMKHATIASPYLDTRELYQDHVQEVFHASIRFDTGRHERGSAHARWDYSIR